MIRAILFDLDGTLLDTSEDLGAALNQLRIAAGLEPLGHETIRPQVSNGANALIKLGFGEALTAQTHQALREALLAAYENAIAVHTRPFKGVAELLHQLAACDMPWGIVTNKPLRYTQALLAKPVLPLAAKTVVCPSDTVPAKPDPAGLHLACAHLQCPPAEVLYVGDHERDIEAGRRAGCVTLAVGYGFTLTTDEHRHWGADGAVDCATDIWPWITVFNHQC